MRVTWRDGIATLLVAAVVIPYIGYLIKGSMPFLQDPRGMAGTGLMLGLAAGLAIGRAGFTGARGRVAALLAGLTGALGIITVIWGEAGTLSEVLLAVFIGGIVVTWAVAELVGSGFFGAEPRHLTHR
jgi:hypothetical protein